jgi:cytochrome c-type biogenesis protein CcmH/NrfF
MLAHAGHWATSLLYIVPVFALIVFLLVQTWRDRRREPEE